MRPEHARMSSAQSLVPNVTRAYNCLLELRSPDFENCNLAHRILQV